MKFANFPEVAAFLGVACGCTLMLTGRQWQVVAGMVLTFGSVVWYAAEGMYRDGASGWNWRHRARETTFDAAAEQAVAPRDRPGA